MNKVSIIIVSFNDEKFIVPCLKSIEETTKIVDYEIIIVDNCSSKPTSQVFDANAFANLQIIRNDLNEGFARAVNKGIEAASGNYYLLLNSDTLVYENCIDKLADFLDNIEDASCVGPKIHTPDGGIERSTHGFPTLLKEFFHALPLLKILIPYRGMGKIISLFSKSAGSGSAGSYWNYDRVNIVENITGACLMVRKSAADEVGLLDPNFWMYSEEIDWNLRFKRAGWNVYFTPEAEILHYFGQSTGQKPRSQKVNHVLIERYRGMVYFFSKHYSQRKTFLLRSIFLSAFTIRLFLAFIKLPFVGFNKFYRELVVFSAILKIAVAGPLKPKLPIREF